ncbi:MAG: hypothetical protein IPG74_09710 [Flavobacteriales bacterium]|nr:hypothetical protein [Flavobacteriales bacterium]MBK7555998.1 hypothetical protein [Flavobacteriales bacterium]MBP6574713.1 hypothetical protein [Flavobacteriales bacterium]
MLRSLTLLLERKRTFNVLLVLNGLVALATCIGFGHHGGGDIDTYQGLAVGILNGEYSYWWPLQQYIPDTFRTPGYPLYIALVMWLFGTWKALTFVQFGIYAASVWLMLKCVGRMGGGLLAKNIALLLLLPSINIPFYIGTMLPEIPVMICIMGICWIWTKQERTWADAIGMGALYAFIFQCRPIFLLFPLCILACDILFKRGRLPWMKEITALGIFGLSLIPFGLWNQSNHGKFSVTPLEGGGGVFHTGYWAGRIPNYREMRYWGNMTGDEIFDFVPYEDRAAEIAAFNAEWDSIDAQLAPFLTHQDTVMLDSIVKIGPVCRTWNTQYTLERDKILIAQTWKNIAEHPGYYFTFKTYSAVRLWVIGIMREDFRNADLKGRIKILYPTLMTLTIFLLAIITVPLALIRKRIRLKEVYPMILLLLYYTAIHLPFTIQARYTTSVRLVLYVLMAMAISALLKKPSTDQEATGKPPVKTQ